MLSLCLLIVVSAAAYVLVCVFGQKPYYRGMLGSLYSSSGVSDRKIDEKSAYRSRGLPFSYVMKEIRVYLRRPTFFVQLILPCLIIPAFMMGITYFSVFSQVGSELMEGLQQIYAEKAFGGYVYSSDMGLLIRYPFVFCRSRYLTSLGFMTMLLRIFRE